MIEVVLKQYIEFLSVNKLKYSENIYNCSFIDLMNIGFWSTGFSGTVNIDIPKNEINTLKQLYVIQTKISVYFWQSLINIHLLINKYYHYKNYQNILDHLNEENYDCLIDISAVFKDHFSNKQVIELISTIEI